MNRLIGLITTFIVDFIKNWWAAYKLANLEKDLTQKKETAIDATEKATTDFDQLMADLDTYNAREDLRRALSPVQPSSKEPASSDSKPKQRAKGPRSPNRRAKRAAKRSKKRVKK